MTEPPATPRPEPAPLAPEMARGAAEMQARLDEARKRLRREVAPPVDEADDEGVSG